jgi:hypothetical protein
MATPSNKTKALKAAWEKILKAGRPEAPELPWKLNAYDNTPEEAINRLIKQAPAGSAKRQELMALKADYFAKLKVWQTKNKQYDDDYKAAAAAWKASEKLDGLYKKQQDNKDTGTKDQKLDNEIRALEETVGAAPKPGAAQPNAGPKPKDSDGDGIPDNIDATPSTPTPKPGATPTPTPPVVIPTPPKGGNTGGARGDNKPPAMTDAEQRVAALDVAGTDFSLPETIFKNVPSLNRLLDRYVKEDWTPDRLRKEIRDDVWYRKNSQEIKERYIQLYNYRDMVASGQADGSTDYEKQISTLERQIADKARAMGSNIASDPTALRKAAENMYITNVGVDDAMTTDFIAAAIKPITSIIGGKKTEGYSGTALANYQSLQSIAKKNGFKISDIVPGAATEQQVLQGIATGRIDINRVAQDARKLAAQGQPQYVRDLLGQGYDLEQIYAPYRDTMANILEINDPGKISLNDQTLRSAISDKGDMNIYDFKRLLKKDNRWQYTENAKREVSGAAMKVLRDFGFQG